MAINQNTEQKQQAGGSNGASGKESFQISAPSISLPKGGGAIRGMGEKFAANPVTGTGSMTVPIATSPGRSGFGPQLALSYDSGAGNGPFGFGWNLSLPSITRKTDKGLPRYQDAVESDVFILSGAEDLVPVLVQTHGNWEREKVDPRPVDNQTYVIQRYRPRIEGLFARIEWWTNQKDPSDCFWRSISKDNITTWYGRQENSRIFDPFDPTRIFSWLICESYDDKGNVIVYQYKAEDFDNVDLSQIHERNRTGTTQDKEKGIRTTNRYLKRIYYGNRDPYLPKIEPGKPLPNPPSPGTSDGKPNWFFEVVFDYDDGDYTEDDPDSDGRIIAHPVYSPANAKWSARVDPFSTYRAGFEVRTYRLCQRVLMFHHFPDELRTPDYLVRSTDFTYSYEDDPTNVRNPIYSFMDSVSQSGYVRQANGSYLKRSLPPLQFEYTQPVVQEAVHDVDLQSLENLPYGLDGSKYQWVDLDGEGLSGILTEQADGWFYKRNLSPINLVGDNGSAHTEASFGPLELVAKKPSLASISAGGQQFLDLAGDGQLDLVAFSGSTPGFFERTPKQDWEPFKTFESLPNLDWSNPNLKFVDLTGDGHADIIITEDEIFWWYPSLAEEGFGPAERLPKYWDEEKGPRLVFADIENSIHLADFSGDGLSDLVRIRNGEVCYWPNLGYGRFGAKVTMDNSPWFENPDQFDPRRIQLADIDGSGTTDIIYLGRAGIDLYFNQSGNGWSKPQRLEVYPQTDNLSSVAAMDLLGNGTACLVWSSPLPGNARRPMRYIDLMGGSKPHLLVKTVNNFGAETTVQYAPSTQFYVQDKLDGKPWITKIPFPVHVVEKTTIKDNWRKTEFSTTYSYHHGYYDGIEREFRGFGRVEQVDFEDYGLFKIRNRNNPYVTDDDRLYQPPVKTVTWFHTGAFLDRETILSHFEDEYFPTWYEALDPTRKNVLGKFQENDLPEPDLDAQDLSTEEWREALRACKGMTLRQEVYELDVQALEKKNEHCPVKLFSTAYHNCHIQRLQPKEQNQHAVFLVTESEAITYHYELGLTSTPGDITPDPRIAHTLNLNIDEFGNVLQSVAVVYPRMGRHLDNKLPVGAEDLIAKVQKELHLAYTENRFTDDLNDSIKTPDDYRLRLPCEVLTYELTGMGPEDKDDQDSPDPGDNLYFAIDELRRLRLSAKYLAPVAPTDVIEVKTIPYHQIPDNTIRQMRLVEHVCTLYFDEALTGPLAPRKINRLGLRYENYKLALTEDLLKDIFVDKLNPANPKGAFARGKLDDWKTSGYLSGADLANRLSGIDTTGQYWIRSGIAGFTADAAQHFYLPERYIDPFGNTTTLNYDSRDLYVQSSTDACRNMVTVSQFDFRVLAPREMKDPNDNYSAAAFDILGMPVASAVMGKTHTESGDDLTNVQTDLTLTEVNAFFTTAYKVNVPGGWLGNATARYVYDLGEKLENGRITYGHRPGGACGILREKHVKQLQLQGGENKIQVGVEYSDGSGNVLVKKGQAEPDPTLNNNTLRWIASGKTVLNNKGKPVKQYEPYFSKTEHGFDLGEAAQETGVTPIMFYDSVGRLVRTELPDGSFSKVEFTPWYARTFDANDTVLESQWYTDRGSPTSSDAEPSDPDRRAAWLTTLHSNTPGETHLDSLGRDVISVAHNKYKDAQATLHDEKYLTFTKLDAEGKPLWIRDARKNLVMQYIVPPAPNNQAADPVTGFAPCYDVAGNLLYQHSMDAGDRWMINDAAGKPMLAWDVNQRQEPNNTFVTEQRLYFTEYDALHRPKNQKLRVNSNPAIVIERYEYRDKLDNDASALQNNLLAQLVRHYDPSGLIETIRRDFKGNVEEVHRSLTNQHQASVIDWKSVSEDITADPQLEKETFVQITEYDALNRMTLLYNWHRDANRVAVYKPKYNPRGLLKSEQLLIRASRTPNGPSGGVNARGPDAISEIRYNVKDQKEYLALGNGTLTEYEYDPDTFRLRQIFTTRPADSGKFPKYRSNLRDGGVVQQLLYTYDPVGNITAIEDQAYKPVFFANGIAEPRSLYQYDSLYRLIAATGRETAQGSYAARDGTDAPIATGFPITDQTLRRYTQTYEYDSVGNFVAMQHSVPGDAASAWMRHYESFPDSNRLHYTWTGSDRAATELEYHFDPHGNMLNLARVAAAQFLRWDHRGMIRSIDLGGGGWVYYQYEASKQRTRKLIKRNGSGVEERLYLGGYDLYRRTVAGTVVEEIESHHLFEREQRVLLVDDVLKTDRTHTDGTQFKPEPIVRYQYSNHLCSACLELDDRAEIISYEECHPYGTSAYRAMKSGIEAPPMRYRYTGMERDEETSLNYHGARYYAAGLVRWLSADPSALTDGLNVFSYCRNAPTQNHDLTGRQTKPTLEDYFYLIRDTGGFWAADTAKGGPPQFKGSHGIPFGTQGHSQSGAFIDAVKALPPGEPFRYSEIDRIYSEVAIQHGTNVVIKIGGSPVPGADNIDVVAAPVSKPNLSGGDVTPPKHFEAATDLKFGGNKTITAGQAQFAQQPSTTSGASPRMSGPTLGPAAETEQTFATLNTELQSPNQPVQTPAPQVDASFSGDAAKAKWQELQAAKVPANSAVEIKAATGLAKEVAPVVAEKTGAKLEGAGIRLSERVGERALEHFPVFGFYIALGLVEEDINKGAYWDALADILGPVPIIGEVALGLQIAAHEGPTLAKAIGEDVPAQFYKTYSSPQDFYREYGP